MRKKIDSTMNNDVSPSKMLLIPVSSICLTLLKSVFKQGCMQMLIVNQRNKRGVILTFGQYVSTWS